MKQNVQLEETGTYFTIGSFIAFRANDSNEWRVSQMVFMGVDLSLTFIGVFYHTWQAIAAMEVKSDNSAH